MIDRVDLFKI